MSKVILESDDWEVCIIKVGLTVKKVAKSSVICGVGYFLPTDHEDFAYWLRKFEEYKNDKEELELYAELFFDDIRNLSQHKVNK